MLLYLSISSVFCRRGVSETRFFRGACFRLFYVMFIYLNSTLVLIMFKVQNKYFKTIPHTCVWLMFMGWPFHWPQGTFLNQDFLDECNVVITLIDEEFACVNFYITTHYLYLEKPTAPRHLIKTYSQFTTDLRSIDPDNGGLS